MRSSARPKPAPIARPEVRLERKPPPPAPPSGLYVRRGVRVELALERLDVLTQLLKDRHRLLLLLLDSEAHFAQIHHEVAGGVLVGDIGRDLLGQGLDFGDSVLCLLLDLLNLLNGGLIIHGWQPPQRIRMEN